MKSIIRNCFENLAVRLQILDILPHFKDWVMPWWRLLGTAASQLVWSICVCVILYICVCVCHVFNTLWDKYLFSSSQFRAHLPTGDKKKIIVKIEWMCCTSIQRARTFCLWVRVLKNSEWNSAPFNHVFAYEKISSPHMPKPLAHTSVSRPDAHSKGFFCSVPTLTSLRICEPEHGLSVTCPGRAAYWDLLSISSPGCFIWDNTDSRASQD